MSPHRAIVAAGSNIEPEKNLKEAAKRLGSRHRLLATSSVRETPPFGNADQANFLDQVFLMETTLDAPAFKASLKEVEDQLGRIRGPENKFGPLTIDLDLIAWNGEVVDPDFYRHEFLREGALEVEPKLKCEGQKSGD